MTKVPTKKIQKAFKEVYFNMLLTLIIFDTKQKE